MQAHHAAGHEHIRRGRGGRPTTFNTQFSQRMQHSGVCLRKCVALAVGRPHLKRGCPATKAAEARLWQADRHAPLSGTVAVQEEEGQWRALSTVVLQYSIITVQLYPIFFARLWRTNFYTFTFYDLFCGGHTHTN